MIIFKYLIEIKLELLGLSIEDILPSLVSKILFGLLILLFTLNVDTVFKVVLEFSNSLL